MNNKDLINELEQGNRQILKGIKSSSNSLGIPAFQEVQSALSSSTAASQALKNLTAGLEKEMPWESMGISALAETKLPLSFTTETAASQALKNLTAGLEKEMPWESMGISALAETKLPLSFTTETAASQALKNLTAGLDKQFTPYTSPFFGTSSFSPLSLNNQISESISSKIIEERYAISSLLEKTENPFSAIQVLKNNNYNDYFAFEGYFADKFANLYNEIPTSSKLYLGKDEIFDNDSLYIQNSDESTYALCNQKDIVGAEILFPEISNEEIIDFISFLARFKTLALEHKVSKKIMDNLKAYKEKKLIKLLSSNALYRARAKGINDMDYLPEEVLEIPYGVTGFNRFSSPDKMVIYLTESPETAIKELKEYESYTLIKANLKSDIEILDMSNKTNIIFDYCLKPKKSNNSHFPREYLLPNFIGDVCEYIGIKGIKYKSTITDDICYVLFNIHFDSFMNVKKI